jgi:hypothetical protein
MFFQRTQPAPHFAQGLFALLLVVFAVISHSHPVLGLTGLGVVLILGSSLVLVNRERIWADYVKRYKKLKKKSSWGAPLQAYYNINVYILFPLLFLLGVGSLIGAWYAS